MGKGDEMKKILAVLVVLIMVWSLAGCGQKEEPPKPAEEQPAGTLEKAEQLLSEADVEKVTGVAVTGWWTADPTEGNKACTYSSEEGDHPRCAGIYVYNISFYEGDVERKYTAKDRLENVKYTYATDVQSVDLGDEACYRDNTVDEGYLYILSGDYLIKIVIYGADKDRQSIAIECGQIALANLEKIVKK